MATYNLLVAIYMVENWVVVHQQWIEKPKSMAGATAILTTKNLNPK